MAIPGPVTTATPTPTITPTSVTPAANAAVDPNLEIQLKSLETQANAEQQAVLQGNQAQWMMPVLVNWSGDLFDFTGMHSPFNRDQSNNWFVDAISDPDNPGTTGDLVLTTLQVDWMACAERAFRARHTMRRPRAVAHAMGRKAGHGDDKGPLVQCVLEYLRGLATESKS